MKLGGSANMLDPFPPKPTGMHWLTYERLQEEHDRVNEVWLRATWQFIERQRHG